MDKIYKPVDLSKVRTIIYHTPDGPAFSVKVDGDGMQDLIEFGYGDICDTSEIDGVIHFFPRGNA